MFLSDVLTSQNTEQDPLKSHLVREPHQNFTLKGQFSEAQATAWSIRQSRKPVSSSWLPNTGAHRQRGSQTSPQSSSSQGSSSMLDRSKELRTGPASTAERTSQLPYVSLALVLMYPVHTLIRAVCGKHCPRRQEAGPAGSCGNPSSTPGCKQQLFVS